MNGDLNMRLSKFAQTFSLAFISAAFFSGNTWAAQKTVDYSYGSGDNLSHIQDGSNGVSDISLDNTGDVTMVLDAGGNNDGIPFTGLNDFSFAIQSTFSSTMISDVNTDRGFRFYESSGTNFSFDGITFIQGSDRSSDTTYTITLTGYSDGQQTVTESVELPKGGEANSNLFDAFSISRDTDYIDEAWKDVDTVTMAFFCTAAQDCNESRYAVRGITIDDATTTDSAAPLYISINSTPIDDSANVSLSNDIVVAFDENIVLGTGEITIYNVTDDNDFETFDVTLKSDGNSTSPAAGRVSISGNKLYINPTNDLLGNRTFAIHIDANAVQDNNGNSFSGINDNTTFNFITLNSAPNVDLNSEISGSDNEANFIEGGGAVNITTSSLVTESDNDTIKTITITLTNDYHGTAEGLSVTASAQNSLTGVSGASDIVLQDTISMSNMMASASEISAFLDAVTYNNTFITPNETSRIVTVVINDGSADSTSRSTTINVEALNRAPSNITLSLTSINQSSTGDNITVGALSTEDADLSDSHTYSLVAANTSENGTCTSGSGNSSFVINGDNLQTRSALIPGTYVACVQTDDTTTTFQKSVTITVLDDVAPISLSITTPIEGDGVINSTEVNSVLISGSDAEASNSITVTVSDSINPTVTRNVIADNGGNWTLSGSELDLSSLNDGSLTVSATQRDASGNTSTPSSQSIVLDTSKPTVTTFTTSENALKAGQNSTIDITLSESSSNFSLIDVTASNGQLSDFTGSGTTYAALLTPTENAEGNVTLEIKAGVFSDQAGNVNIAATPLSLSFDTLPPNGHRIEIDQASIDATNESAMSFTLSDAEVGSYFTYEITDGVATIASPGSTLITSAVQQVTGLDVTTLLETDLMLSVVLTDTSENVSEAVTDTVAKQYDAAPVAMDDSFSTNEDTSVQFDILANDSDINDDLVASSAIVQSQPVKGQISITNGIVTYTPNANVSGADSFVYTVKDAKLQESNTAIAKITINAINDAPVATDLVINTDEDTASNALNVRNSSTDLEDNIPTGELQIVSAPQIGEVILDQEAGTIVYTPNPNAFGSDNFTYTVSDSEGLVSNTATVSVNIGAINDAPIANADSLIFDEDITSTLDVLSNDTDIEDSAFVQSNITLQDLGQGSGIYPFATVSINQDGTLDIAPTQDINGVHSFTYTLTDSGQAVSHSAVVTLSITAINDAPIAIDNTAQLFEEGQFEVNVLGNDTDVDSGDTLNTNSVSVSLKPNNGIVQVTSTGTIIYTPNTDFYGEDNFTYTVEDTAGALSNEATVTMTVTPVNDAPTATSQSLTLSEDENLDITLIGRDIESDSLTYTITTQPLNGTLLQLSYNMWRYIPSADYHGSDSFEFIANDGELGSEPATITLSVLAINDAPFAQHMAIKGREEQALTITLEGEDVEGSPLTYRIINQPQHGSVTLNGNKVTYHGNDHYFGEDSFTYVVNDGELDSDPAIVSLTLSNVHDAPIIVGTPSTLLNQGETYTFTPVVTDVDSSKFTFSAKNLPDWLTLDPLTGTLSGTPSNDDVGSVSNVLLTVSDGKTSTSLPHFNLTVNNVNDEPQAINDIYIFTQEDEGTYLLDVLSNDSDEDGDNLKLVWISSSAGSVEVIGSQLKFIYDKVGTTTLQYGVSDGNGGKANATVEVSIESSELNAPSITAPTDIEANATGLYTKVPLGVAMAKDSIGNDLPVSLVDGRTLFAPGITTVFWSTQDSEGNIAQDVQLVTVHPLVSIEKDGQTTEGTSHSVNVILNGSSPSYPVTIPYTVSGTASSSDHSLRDGQVVIESGTTGTIDFDVLTDDVSESIETIIIDLDAQLNLGSKHQYVLTISEQNVAPTVEITIYQSGEKRSRIEKTNDIVTVTAALTDANTSDRHILRWSTDNDELATLIAGQEANASLYFSAEQLPNAIYSLTLRVTDDGDKPLSVTQNAFIEVNEALPTLSASIDSDGDLIPDAEEGHNDSDNDGIPDYLDAISDCNVVQQRVIDLNNFLVEGQPGVCLRKGVSTLENQTGGVELLESELLQDEQASNIGGIFDFVATGLPQAGQSYQLVIPQRLPIPANAVYRKFQAEQGWQDFVIDMNNSVASTLGERGYCPPPGGASWIDGLNEGHWCVQVTIKDGGPNDDDNIANGTIIDPSGVAVRASDAVLPQPTDDKIKIHRNGSATIDVLNNDTTSDGQSLSISHATTNIGRVSIVNNQLYYTAANQFIGEDNINYSVTDSVGGTGSANVAVTVINSQAPYAIDDFSQTNDRSMITMNVLSNDYDPDNDALSVVSAVAIRGTVTINDQEALLYTPPLGFEGEDSITYLIQDTHGLEAKGKVTVKVTLTHDAVVSNQSGAGSMNLIWLFLLSFLTAMRSHKLQCAFVALLAVSFNSRANWFVEGELGISEADDRNISSTETLYSTDTSDRFFSVAVGYSIDPDWSVSLRYIDMGSGSARLKSTTTTPTQYHQSVASIAPILVQGFGFDTRYRFWKQGDWFTDVTLGVISWETEVESKYLDNKITTQFDGIDSYAGLGVGYTVTDRVSITLKLSRYFLDENDIDTATAILRYQWPR
ncbi:tandem-95 repeat protein [Vibrio jasicida]|uniref:tandem-95 repeat protein n=1 Tax=Vibrio jasicida TaxID=766224 RepID=UPI0040698A61